MKPYFEKGTALTISMWDFSWLKCGHPGGAFHDLARCVAEAAERGYNTLRIDAFPHAYQGPNLLSLSPSPTTSFPTRFLLRLAMGPIDALTIGSIQIR
jgi:hypothetical protein